MKLVVAEHDKACSSPPARAARPRSTPKHLGPVHIIRKVLLRVESYLDYIIIKHSISVALRMIAMPRRRPGHVA